MKENSKVNVLLFALSIFFFMFLIQLGIISRLNERAKIILIALKKGLS